MKNIIVALLLVVIFTSVGGCVATSAKVAVRFSYKGQTRWMVGSPNDKLTSFSLYSDQRSVFNKADSAFLDGVLTQESPLASGKFDYVNEHYEWVAIRLPNSVESDAICRRSDDELQLFIAQSQCKIVHPDGVFFSQIKFADGFGMVSYYDTSLSNEMRRNEIFSTGMFSSNKLIDELQQRETSNHSYLQCFLIR